VIPHDPLDDLVARQRAANMRRVLKTAGAVFSPGDLRLLVEFARYGAAEDRVQAVQALAPPAELRLLCDLAARMTDAQEQREGYGLGDVADAIALLAANNMHKRFGAPKGADLVEVMKFLTGAEPAALGAENDPDDAPGALPYSHSVESWARRAYPYVKAATPYVADFVAFVGTALAPEAEPLWIGIAAAGNTVASGPKQLNP